jgi:hypothetical protein
MTEPGKRTRQILPMVPGSWPQSAAPALRLEAPARPRRTTTPGVHTCRGQGGGHGRAVRQSIRRGQIVADPLESQAPSLSSAAPTPAAIRGRDRRATRHRGSGGSGRGPDARPTASSRRRRHRSGRAGATWQGSRAARRALVVGRRNSSAQPVDYGAAPRAELPCPSWRATHMELTNRLPPAPLRQSDTPFPARYPQISGSQASPPAPA